MFDNKNFYKVIENNFTNLFEFQTHIYGANLNYGANLVEDSGLLPYYENTQKVIKELESLGYEGVKISENLDIPPLNLYHSFEDKDGNNLGTYLVFSMAKPFIKFKEISEIELTDDMRETIVENLPSQTIDSFTDFNYDDNIIPIEDQNISKDIDNVSKEEIQNEILKEWLFYNSLQFQQNDLVSSTYTFYFDNNQTNKTRNWFEDAGTFAFEVVSDPAGSVADLVEGGVSGIGKITDDGKERFESIKDGDLLVIADTALGMTNPGYNVIQGGNQIIVGDSNVFNSLKEVWVNGCNSSIKKTIKGVSFDSKSDDWTTKIQLRNPEGDGCVPISASMIVNYHNEIRMGKNSLYNGGDTNNPVFSPIKSNRIKLAVDMYSRMGTDYNNGTTASRYLRGYVTRAIKEAFMRNNLSSNPTAYLKSYNFFSIESTGTLIEKYIKNNYPVIINYGINWSIDMSFTNNIWKQNDKYGQHAMPVIGYKKYFVIPCFGSYSPIRRYLYVDTTWGYKTSIRLDRLSGYLSFGTVTFIKR